MDDVVVFYVVFVGGVFDCVFSGVLVDEMVEIDDGYSYVSCEVDLD